jgi:hypothetical protein
MLRRTMKHPPEHLPVRKQRQLDGIVRTIRAAVDAEMIILYGSHARRELPIPGR